MYLIPVTLLLLLSRVGSFFLSVKSQLVNIQRVLRADTSCAPCLSLLFATAELVTV